jgi:hypothetical protein
LSRSQRFAQAKLSFPSFTDLPTHTKCEATTEPRAMEQENDHDHPSTFLKSARKGVTDWVQQRLLEVPRLKQNASSSSEAPSDGLSHSAPEGLRPDNDQSSPQFATDRLCFPVSFLMGGGIRPEQDRALFPCIVLLLVWAIGCLSSRTWECTTTPIRSVVASNQSIFLLGVKT